MNDARQRQKGFLLVEILIAGLILTASIAAAMYLFRMGYIYLEKANWSNTVSVKLIQAANVIMALDLEKKTGVEDMGDGVTMKWSAHLISSARPTIGDSEMTVLSMFTLFLYQVKFSLIYRDSSRDYQINVFRYQSHASSETGDF
ncbi:MAG: hypothetical protein WC347_01125 [Smithellaceae bacterium]|jgi:hypothetical protein